MRRKIQFIAARPPAANLQFQNIQNADEAGDKFVDRLLIHLLWRADLFQAPLRKNHDAAGHFHRLFLVVGDEQRWSI